MATFRPFLLIPFLAAAVAFSSCTQREKKTVEEAEPEAVVDDMKQPDQAKVDGKQKSEPAGKSVAARLREKREKKSEAPQQQPQRMVASEKASEKRAEPKHEPKELKVAGMKGTIENLRAQVRDMEVPAEMTRAPASSSSSSTMMIEDPAQQAFSDPRSCRPVEYSGEGPHAKLGDREWSRVADLFEGVKKDIERWLGKNQSKFGKTVATTLRNRVHSIQIERPPFKDEPDLAWRGIAILDGDRSGRLKVKVGGGFVKLAESDLHRAKFEMARTVAQALAPCGLEVAEIGKPWDGFLRCMKIDHSNECTKGGYAESGWAVSSAIALEVANPGCEIPAFSAKPDNECRKRFLLPMTLVGLNEK